MKCSAELETCWAIWRCMYCASYCNVYINQRDAQILVNNLYFFVIGSTYFGLSLVYHQEQSFLYPYSSQTYRHECTNCIVQLIKCRSWWWTNDSLKHVEPINGKIKIIHKNLCVLLVYIHTARPCSGSKCVTPLWMMNCKNLPHMTYLLYIPDSQTCLVNIHLWD